MARRVLNGLDLSNTKINNLGDPSEAGDAVNLGYVENFVRGLSWGKPVVAASNADVDLGEPGASLDGVSLTAGDRILLKNQTDLSENGVYEFVASGEALTRAADMAGGSEIRSGRATTVLGGLINDNRVYLLSNDSATVTIGTDDLDFVQLGGGGVSYAAGNGLSLNDDAFSVSLQNNSGLVVDGTGLGVSSSIAGDGLDYSSGVLEVDAGSHLSISAGTLNVDTSDLTTSPNTVVRKYAAAVPSGNTSATVTHSLGTRDVTVAVYENSGSYEQVFPDIEHTSTNAVTLIFAVAPTTNEFRVVVHG